MKPTATGPEGGFMPTFPEGGATGRCAVNRSLPHGRSRAARQETDTGAPAAWGTAGAPESIPVALNR